MQSQAASRVELLENRIAPALVSAFNVSQLVGRNGFVSTGADAGDHAGASISNIGDFNDDGLDDFLIAAPDAEGGGTGRGAAYIVLGSLDTKGAPVPLASADGTRVIAIHGESDGDAFGSAVGGAGDVNNDGYDDIIVGASNVNVGNFRTGAAYVIFGGPGPFPETIDLATPPVDYGFRIGGNGAGDETGASVAGAGDVNGDGFADIIVGSPDHSFSDNPGEGGAFVVFGAASFPAQFNVASINGTNGFAIAGNQPDANWGASVAGIGDFNGDGFADIALGAPTYDDGKTPDTGEVAVIFGHTGTFTSPLTINSLNGTTGFVLYGPEAGSNVGASVSSAGDFNGDGRADLIVGAPHSGQDSPIGRGSAYVIFGGSIVDTASVNIGRLTVDQGFTFLGGRKPDGTGFAVSSVGDLNADGFDDLIVGTAPKIGNLEGSPGKGGDNAFVILGKATVEKPVLQPSQLDGSNGLIIFPKRHTGFAFSVGGGGDYNGDGFADLLIGAPADLLAGQGSGSVFTVFGGQKVGDTKAFDPKRFEFVDRDGDIVTIKTNKGELPREAFQLEPAASGTGLALTKLDLTATSGSFENGKLTISVDSAAPALAQKLGTRGISNDGSIEVGEIDARGTNLKELTIDGDVYIVRAGESGGKGAAATSATEPITPGISIFKALSIGQSATYSSLSPQFEVPNGIRELRVTGNINDLTAALTGRLTKLVVGGVIKDTTMSVNGTINSFKAKNGIENTTVNVSDSLKNLTVTGDVTMGTIRVGNVLKTFHVTGDMIDSQITGPGTSTKPQVFNKITVDGDVIRSRILAGYDSGGVAVNGDARIGSIKIGKGANGGNFLESLIVAGVDAGVVNGYFDGDEALSTSIGGPSTSAIAKIASIKILGTADGTLGGTDHFGIIAEQIVSLTIGNVAQVLTDGPGNDLYPGLSIGTTGDVSVVEVNS